MKNRLLIVISALLLCVLIAFPLTTAHAATYIEHNNFRLEFPSADNDSQYYVEAYLGNETSVVIPAEILGKDIVKINNHAFLNMSSIISITLPESLEIIGDSAFANCSSIKTIALPANVNKMGTGAFNGCTGIRTFTFSSDDNLNEISAACFSGCSSLLKISIPLSVTEIGNYAFAGCSKLMYAVIGPNVTTIAENAFENCSKLTIQGWEDTYAQEYAEANSIPFSSFGVSSCN